MAKGKTPSSAAPAASKSDRKTIHRKKRNALERKCLPKYYKSLYSGSDKATFKSILEAWQESRKKVKTVTTV